jgi:3-isopropylmalate/(R)-2-methylmalate dehydratase small subunit
LLVGENFGCGSSREHAVWALMDYGFLIVIAPSFADIFFSNCFKNGLLPIRLDKEMIDKLRAIMTDNSNVEASIDLQNQIIKVLSPISQTIPFDIDPYKKKILLEGLDDIAQTLAHENKISEFEKKSTLPSVL